MTAEKLSSNVVNYLVWRYLQEAGFKGAAAQLAKAWIENPDDLPFSRNVRPHALVSMLQDALWADEIQAHIREGSRRYVFGPEHGNPFAHGAVVSSEAAADRQGSRLAVNGTAVDAGAGAAASRRKRKSTGTERSNGETLELESNGVSHGPNADMEAVMSDAESAVEDEMPNITTLSIGQDVDVQTEKPAIRAQHQFLDTENEKLHVAWHPETAEVLMTGGASKLDLFIVPPSSAPIEKTSIALPLTTYSVTAFCWRGKEEASVAVVQTHVAEDGNGHSTTAKLFDLENGGDEFQSLHVQDWVVALRWNPASQMLLSVGSMSLIEMCYGASVWRKGSSEPLCSMSFPGPVTDAAWVSDHSFVLCGPGLLAVYGFDPSSGAAEPAQRYETDADWEKVKYDPISGIIACAEFNESRQVSSPGGRAPSLGIVLPGDASIRTHQCPGGLSGLEFQPILNPASQAPAAPALLATSSSAERVVRLWNAKEPFTLIRTLDMKDYVEAIAFSPDGYLIAAASADSVQFWNAESGGPPRATWTCPDDVQTDVASGSAEEKEMIPGPGFMLSWDADGQRVAFTVRNKVAIIGFPRSPR